MQNPLWLDARSQAEYDADHIPNALLLTFSQWDSLIDPFLDAWGDTNSPVIIYCTKATCDTSEQVAKKLREATAKENIYFLEGGWEAWSSRSVKP